jgi:hypothetical protein
MLLKKVYLFIEILEFELRASLLIDRYSTT